MKRFFIHALVVLAGILVLLGVPFMTTDYFRALLSGTADAVTSASVIIDQPSGEYLVLINGEAHPDEGNLDTWVRFFSGEEISYLFEDISCSVMAGDQGALTMARSFQSRLPEKQMSIRQEDATLVVSRADEGKYDILILSREFAESYHAESVNRASDIRIELTGGTP